MTPNTTSDATPRHIQVYFLHAAKDQEVSKAIHRHLSPIIRSSALPIEVNGDFDIPIGADREKYKQRLLEADIVLVLISSDFIDDDDLYSRNQKVIERYNRHETMMVPLLVRNCLWKRTPFAQLNVLPRNFQPLNNKQFWNSEDDAITAVVSDIYDSIEQLTQSGVAVLPPSAATPLAAAAAPLSAIPAPLVSPAFVPPVTTAPTASATGTGKWRAQPVEVDWRDNYYRRVIKKRAWALLLDYLILGFVPVFVLGVLGNALEEDLAALGGVLSVLAFYLVAPWMESSEGRGTVGKRIMKLQITDPEGNRITFWRALWRNFLRSLIFYSYLLFGIGLIFQYFRFKKTRKLFHDEMSNTVIGEKLVRVVPATMAGAVMA